MYNRAAALESEVSPLKSEMNRAVKTRDNTIIFASKKGWESKIFESIISFLKNELKLLT